MRGRRQGGLDEEVERLGFVSEGLCAAGASGFGLKVRLVSVGVVRGREWAVVVRGLSRARGGWSVGGGDEVIVCALGA